MLFFNLLSCLCCAVVIGTAMAHFPSSFAGVFDAQKSIESGLFGNELEPGGVVDVAVARSSPHISLGDVVSLTTAGQATFGFHLLLHRYPLEVYLGAAGRGTSAAITIPRTALMSVSPPALQGLALSATAATSGAIRVNSTRGLVGIEQCGVLLPDSEASSVDEGPAESPFGRVFEAQAGELRHGPVVVGTTTIARATGASLVLFLNTTTALAPQNEHMYFSSPAAADTFAPSVSLDAADLAFNGGARGFPQVTRAFFLLKYVHSGGFLTSESLPVPLMMDEDPTDASAFTFGLHGARSTSPSGTASAAGRSAIFLVPIPRQHRVAAFPTSDRECIRFGINASTSNTNVGLVPSAVSGSVPILYHRGCFMAVVAPVSESGPTADAISGVMGSVVAQWLALNERGSGTGYTDTVMAARRVTDGSGSIGARDGSSIRFVPVAVGPSATSASYNNLLRPMQDGALAYLPPAFVSWVGGVASLGTCGVPQFFEADGSRRISAQVG